MPLMVIADSHFVIPSEFQPFAQIPTRNKRETGLLIMVVGWKV